MFSDILLTVDYDRTLTAPDSTIPQRNLEAIRYFMDNGGAFTVNTGRSVPMSRSFLDKVPVNAPLLLYNGSAAYDIQKKQFIFCHPIELDLWDMVRKCQELFPGYPVEMQGVDAHYRFWEDPAWDAFCDFNGCARVFARPGDEIGPFVKLSVYGHLKGVGVSYLFTAEPEVMAQMDEMEKTLREVLGDKCEVFRAGARIIDIHAKGVSKNRSARELQKTLGRKTLVCIGDGENDVSMLEGADFAFCPSDAVVADRFPNVCPCAEGAVADVIYEKIPEILGIQP